MYCSKKANFNPQTHITITDSDRSEIQFGRNFDFYVQGRVSRKSRNFSGSKSNIQIEIQRIRAQVLTSKLLHFVSLNDSFIMLHAKLLKPRSLI